MLRFAYNTNGLAHHRVEDAMRILADLGYDGIAITPDVGQIDLDRLHPGEVERVRSLAESLGLAISVETGGRFILDPRRKHSPTLLDEDKNGRDRRFEYLCRCVSLGADLGAECVSFWSGCSPQREEAERGEGAGVEVAWARLADGVARLLAFAAERNNPLGFEPEPGMFIARPKGCAQLLGRLGNEGEGLGLTLDVGHCLCTGDLPVPDVIREWAIRLIQVQLDDTREGFHEHRMFGEGDLDLKGTLASLEEAGYEGLAQVELRRNSHNGPDAAKAALQSLREARS